MFFCSEVFSQGKIKVILERFQNGNPKLIRYFNAYRDTTVSFQVDNKIGSRKLTKPISIISETYFESGGLEYRGKYEKGLAVGLFEFFYETGLPLARSYYKNGNICDSLVCYYPSGKLKRVVIEVDKIKNYWHNIDYFENGNKSIECDQFQQPDSIVLEGRYQEWHENGQKAFEAILKDNWTIGKWKTWDENGNLIEESSAQIRIPSIGEG